MRRKNFSFLQWKNGESDWDKLCEKYEQQRLTYEKNTVLSEQSQIENLVHIRFLMCYLFREYQGQIQNIACDVDGTLCIRDIRILRPLWDFRNGFYEDKELNIKVLSRNVIEKKPLLWRLKNRGKVSEDIIRYYMEKEGYKKEEQERICAYIQRNIELKKFEDDKFYPSRMIKFIVVLAVVQMRIRCLGVS